MALQKGLRKKVEHCCKCALWKRKWAPYSSFMCLSFTCHARAASWFCDRDDKAAAPQAVWEVTVARADFHPVVAPSSHSIPGDTSQVSSLATATAVCKCSSLFCYTNTLMGFSACLHEKHNVPGRLLRNCSSEPNSATALEMGKSSKAKRTMFVSIREELALNIDRNSLPCWPELTTALICTRSFCLSSLEYRKDFK